MRLTFKAFVQNLSSSKNFTTYSVQFSEGCSRVRRWKIGPPEHSHTKNFGLFLQLNHHSTFFFCTNSEISSSCVSNTYDPRKNSSTSKSYDRNTAQLQRLCRLHQLCSNYVALLLFPNRLYSFSDVHHAYIIPVNDPSSFLQNSRIQCSIFPICHPSLKTV